MGFAALLAAQSLSVTSVWLPGSPSSLTQQPGGSAESEDRCTADPDPPIMTSVSVLLAGIILARVGLWISDLSVTQILQENVEEGKRGVMGGVQTSLHNTFNMIKFCLVVGLPQEDTFGLLILLSYSFICLGAASLAVYTLQQFRLQAHRLANQRLEVVESSNL